MMTREGKEHHSDYCLMNVKAKGFRSQKAHVLIFVPFLSKTLDYEHKRI